MDAVQFVTDQQSSMRAVGEALEPSATPAAQKVRPLYRRSTPAPQSLATIGFSAGAIDLTKIALPAFGPDHTAERAAAFLMLEPRRRWGAQQNQFWRARRRGRWWKKRSMATPPRQSVIPVSERLAVLAVPDYFPEIDADTAVQMVSAAVLAANPGWCGTFAPGVDGAFDLIHEHVPEGNYEMSQMHLLQMVYGYYDRLSAPARELLVRQLPARGRIHRPRLNDTFTRARLRRLACITRCGSISRGRDLTKEMSFTRSIHG
jgi:hypothetical protein